MRVVAVRVRVLVLLAILAAGLLGVHVVVLTAWSHLLRIHADDVRIISGIDEVVAELNPPRVLKHVSERDTAIDRDVLRSIWDCYDVIRGDVRCWEHAEGDILIGAKDSRIDPVYWVACSDFTELRLLSLPSVDVQCLNANATIEHHCRRASFVCQGHSDSAVVGELPGSGWKRCDKVKALFDSQRQPSSVFDDGLIASDAIAFPSLTQRRFCLPKLLNQKIDTEGGHKERKGLEDAWAVVEAPGIPPLLPAPLPTPAHPGVLQRRWRWSAGLFVLTLAFILNLATFANFRAHSARLVLCSLAVVVVFVWVGLHLCFGGDSRSPSGARTDVNAADAFSVL